MIGAKTKEFWSIRFDCHHVIHARWRIVKLEVVGADDVEGKGTKRTVLAVSLTSIQK